MLLEFLSQSVLQLLEWALLILEQVMPDFISFLRQQTLVGSQVRANNKQN